MSMDSRNVSTHSTAREYAGPSFGSCNDGKAVAWDTTTAQKQSGKTRIVLGECLFFLFNLKPNVDTIEANVISVRNAGTTLLKRSFLNSSSTAPSYSPLPLVLIPQH